MQKCPFSFGRRQSIPLALKLTGEFFILNEFKKNGISYYYYPVKQKINKTSTVRRLYNFKNIYRVLKRGGEFIIADAFTSNKCQSILEYAKKVGFTLLRICDITKNVLQSCKAISKNRIEVLGKSYREMIGAPGS